MPTPTKPEQIYDNSWIMVLFHEDYAATENILNIPEVFTNFHFLHKPNTPEDIREEIISEFKEFIGENKDSDWLLKWDIVMYYLEFEDSDKLTEFEDMLNKISGPDDEGVIGYSDYHTLINTLPKCKEIKFRIKDVEPELSGRDWGISRIQSPIKLYI